MTRRPAKTKEHAMPDLEATTGVGDAFDLSGRVAVLTGAASGIGRATAHVLSGAGATVVLGDIDEKGAQATVDEITSRGGTALPLRADVTKRADVDALVDRAAGEYGHVDIMANIAGVPHNQMVADVTDDELERILAINLKSVFYGCQAALRVMTPQKSGNIVNISSGAIDTPAPTLACYGMTKAAVAMLTKTVAMEAGAAGIRVNALAPGVILTNFSRQHFVDPDGTVNEERLQQYKRNFGAMSPLGRIGTPEDVAWSILYLVSDAAAFVTGQIIRPNGGVSMPW
jgi:3-oxoacyl-[acyl-carrier protein] reductase